MSGTGDGDNRMAPVRTSRARPGDVPGTLAARYLIERDMTGRRAAFFRDHREDVPRFVDRGGSLVAASAWPDAVRDMLEVARHRGWNGIRVRGSPAFTREVWIQARSLGLDVTGHRPTTRDRQAVAGPANRRDLQEGPARRRLDEIAVVLRAIVPGPADRDSSWPGPVNTSSDPSGTAARGIATGKGADRPRGYGDGQRARRGRPRPVRPLGRRP